MKKKISLTIIAIVMLLGVATSSYAAVEIVPSKNGKGTDQIVNTSISNSYLLCQGMKSAGESLEGSSVLPHLATNKDWGAVSYLANSMYGTNTAGKNTGVEITMNGVKYYSTTGNETGVMNWGINPNATRYTQTAGIINTYDNSTSTAKDNITEIYNNMNSRFVEKIKTESFNVNNTLGMAMAETGRLYGNLAGVSSDNRYPISIREGLFGFLVGHNLNFYASGASNASGTFRPVIWNN